MRRVYGLSLASLIVAAVIAVLTSGCGLLGQLLQGDGPAVCVVSYENVAEGLDIGTDGCGNLWFRQDGRCWLPGGESGEGEDVEIACPAAGDTLAVVP